VGSQIAIEKIFYLVGMLTNLKRCHLQSNNLDKLIFVSKNWANDPRVSCSSHTSLTSLNPVPNAHVCVYLTVHITKLQLQTTFPKLLYIQHFACIHWDPGR